MKLLEIQSSVRCEDSISRTLNTECIQTWQAIHPNSQHIVPVLDQFMEDDRHRTVATARA